MGAKSKKGARLLDKVSTQVTTILIVGDDQTAPSLVKMVERDAYAARLARSAGEAMQILQSEEIAVILCDYQASGMSSVELLQRMRVLAPDAVRVLLISRSELDSVVEATHVAQVSQFVLKPWDEPSLRRRITRFVDHYRLVVNNQRLQEITARQHKELARAHAFLRQEMEIGQRVQQGLLLGKTPREVSGLSVSAMTLPSQQMGGDFYDFYQPSEGILDVAIGDVMGKGIPAALAGTAIKAQLLRFAEPVQRLSHLKSEATWEAEGMDVGEIVARTQGELAQPLMDIGMFVTLLYGRLNMRSMSFSYIDCGFPRALHYRARAGVIEGLEGDNLPIGVALEERYRQREISLGVGDCLLFYSDGVTEAATSRGEEIFGERRLMRLLAEHAQESPESLIDAIRKSVAQHVGREHFDDDLTLIVVKVSQVEGSQLEKVRKAIFRSDLSLLSSVHGFAENLCAGAPGDAKLLVQHVKLLASEAFTNIVRHSYQGDVRGKVRVQGELTRDGVVLILSDQGAALDPSGIFQPDFSGEREGGFGLFIIEKLADRVTYREKERSDGWNALVIEKNFIRKGGAMNLTQELRGSVLVVKLEGKTLDASDAPTFKQEIIEAIEKMNTARVVLDFSGLEFIDSSGLGALLSILRQVNAQAGDLRLAQMSESVRAMFQVVRMHKLFQIFTSVSEAVNSFSPAQASQ